MENTDNSQLELFSQTKDSASLKATGRSRAFLTYIWGYEKTILTIVAVIITGVISFSLGVEKGKRLSSLGSTRLDIASAVGKTEAKPLISRIQPIQENKPKNDNATFTIQLASYKTKSYAQKEAQALKKKGLSAQVLSKKGYSVLCVGSFVSKEEALRMLSELKKRYQDCHIRRL